MKNEQKLKRNKRKVWKSIELHLLECIWMQLLFPATYLKLIQALNKYLHDVGADLHGKSVLSLPKRA